MLRTFHLEGKKYLVELDEVVEVLDDSDKLEVDSGGNDESFRTFRVRILLSDDAEILTRVRMTDFPRTIQEELVEELGKIALNTVSIVANPYFDEVMIFYGDTVLTSQDHYKPISCDHCSKPGLHLKSDKQNKSGYIKTIKEKLIANLNPDWPFKENLAIQFSVSDTQSRLNKIDLDNLAKTIFDSLQGVVFEDDVQIVRHTADKEFVNGIIAHIVAIKRLAPGERPKFQEFLFSSKIGAWADEYALKLELNKPTRFSRY
jgi:Holliday junction resolvase RusA-like endonuclease